jgi:hypothetical protein
MWGSVLTPASGYNTPNCNSETPQHNTGKSAIFHYVLTFLNNNILLYSQSKGVQILWKGQRDKQRCFLTFLSYFEVLYITK